MDCSYLVYCYTSPSGKKYVGQTKKNLDYRANHGKGYQSCKGFYNAIKKYGWEWFEQHREILKSNLTKEDADFWERFYIETFDTINNGYNIQKGGEFNPSEILSIPIVSIDCKTKEVVFHNSGVEAAKLYGLNNKNISSCLREEDGRTSGGKVWVYRSDWDNMSEAEREKLFSIIPYQHPKKTVAVRCIETGECFNSIKEAAEKMESPKGGICNCCKGKQKTTISKIGKTHWEYI